jgi:hypothetical protein
MAEARRRYLDRCWHVADLWASCFAGMEAVLRRVAGSPARGALRATSTYAELLARAPPTKRELPVWPPGGARTPLRQRDLRRTIANSLGARGMRMTQSVAMLFRSPGAGMPFRLPSASTRHRLRPMPGLPPWGNPSSTSRRFPLQYRIKYVLTGDKNGNELSHGGASV